MQCLICENDGTRNKALFDVSGYTYKACSGCGLVFTDPLPTARQIVDYYATHSVAGSYDQGKQDEVAGMRRQGFVSYLQRFEAETGCRIAGKDVLDIGCFNGLSLQAIASMGGDPYGLEFQESAAKTANERFPGRVTVADICAPLALGRQFDVITLNDVLEHVPDPQAALQNIWGLLREGGYLLATTPDTGSWMARLMGRNWPSMVPVHHIFLFDRRNLGMLLQQFGFEPVCFRTLWKRYHLDYVRFVLSDFKPALGRVMGWIPPVLRRFPLPLNGGEMLVVARRQAVQQVRRAPPSQVA